MISFGKYLSKRKCKDSIEELVFAFRKRARNLQFKPVFIIGCGRSGTSMLGWTLGEHPAVHFLEEPAFIYNRIFPEMDLFGLVKNSNVQPKLIFDESDFEISKANQLYHTFHRKLIFWNKKVLIEKMPTNVFRLELMHKIFPNARFIFIQRNGLEVAKSIEGRGPLWFGRNGIKWKLLKSHASAIGTILPLLDSIEEPFEKGLLEWRISMDLMESFISKIPISAYIIVKYSKFVENPVSETEKIFDFIGLAGAEKVNDFIVKNIKRRSPKLSVEDFQNKERLQQIGGKHLLQNLSH